MKHGFTLNGLRFFLKEELEEMPKEQLITWFMIAQVDIIQRMKKEGELK
tara:strand:- start:614 stop:760 length:147 start_codon:yes stop_codon:yes gene_type:complete